MGDNFLALLDHRVLKETAVEKTDKKRCAIDEVYEPIQVINHFIAIIIRDIKGPRRKPVFGGLRTKKDADQPAHPQSLISNIVIRFSESIISKLATGEI